MNRIIIAMSGGVDSSVAAALVKEAGNDAIGITLQLYDHGEAISKKGACCTGKDIYDAGRVCEKLEIPHYVLNYENAFKESVIDEFVDSYMMGETPVPCIRCNQTVKFRDMMQAAKNMNADALVTGHYVRRIEKDDGLIELHKAVDAEKDQSYFLFATTKEQLEYLRFPLGNMTKTETRNHAKRFGLDVADKAESQDICFVPNGSYSDLVRKLRPEADDSGEIQHIDGRVLGTHNGIINYTVGQRKGLGISNPDPLYVVKIESDTKLVIVGEESALYKNEFFIKDINWLGNEIPLNGAEVTIKPRSTAKDVKAVIYPPNEDGIAKIVLDSPAKSISPGQACVVYSGTRVLGGGFIT